EQEERERRKKQVEETKEDGKIAEQEYDAGSEEVLGSEVVSNNPNSVEGLAELRNANGVNEQNLQVEAVLEHNGQVFYDVNQTARNVASSTDQPLPIYNEKRALAGKPNNTTSDTHAEIGTLGQSHAAGNRGGDAVLTIHGKDACSFCQSDLKKMATQLELQRLEVRQPSNTVIFNGPDDFKPTKKGGLRWPK
ncbi:MAG: hypothetical protein P8X74_22925, partial [Reinekea sp.]